MSLLSVYQLKANAEFKSRVASAVAKAAYDILNESVDIPNHSERVAWAKTAMKDAALVAEQMMWTIVQNATIQSEGTNSTDNDIQFVVNSNVDYFAV
jgi:hypothetical protein